MISVIVPVYNSERYLHRCINSILSQSYKNIEVIIVDDGSTDKSSIICDDYAKTDSRIKVFHQENQGVAAARQRGLELSSGDYIIHCDSDDWMDSCMLEELIIVLHVNQQISFGLIFIKKILTAVITTLSRI